MGALDSDTVNDRKIIKTDPQPTHTSDTEDADSHKPLLQLIHDIRAGRIDVKQISTAQRRACVEQLTGDGFSRAEVATVLHIGDRTVARDRAAIRRDHALKADPELIGQMVGEFYRLAECTTGHIRRAVRDSQTAAALRVDAHYRCFQIGRDLIKTLQSLGYLPTAITQIAADMTHRTEPPVTVTTIHAELDRIRTIQQDCRPDDEQLQRDFQLLESTVNTLFDLDAEHTALTED